MLTGELLICVVRAELGGRDLFGLDRQRGEGVAGFGTTCSSGRDRRILYALDAILRLHFAQEEELLASITLDGPVK
jgi:hypothetical protein